MFSWGAFKGCPARDLGKRTGPTFNGILDGTARLSLSRRVEKDQAVCFWAVGCSKPLEMAFEGLSRASAGTLAAVITANSCNRSFQKSGAILIYRPTYIYV